MASNPYDQFDTRNPYDQFDTTAGAAVAPSSSVSDAAEYDPQSAAYQQRYGATSGNSFLQNTRIGIGKLYTDALLGARQLYAHGADAFAGGNSYAGLQQEAAEKRAIDAPIQATGGGKVGQVLGALPLALIPGANTYAGAGIIGGTLGATQPTIAGESRGLNTAFGAGAGLAGKYAGDVISNWVTNRAAMPFTGWRQATANDALAGSLKANSLDNAGIAEVARDIDSAFRGGRSAATVVDLSTQGGSLAQTLASGARRLNPSGQAEFTGNSAVQDLMEHLRNGNVNAEQLGQISSDLYDQAHSIMSTKGSDKMVGKALFKVREEVEDLIQSHIVDPAARQAYSEARGMYPIWKAIHRPTIFNSSSGDLNPRNMGSYLQKVDWKGFAEGGNQSPLYQAARWGQETRMGNAPPVPVFQLGKWLRYHASNSPVLGAVGGTVSRTLAPIAPGIRYGLPALGELSAPVALPYLEQ